MNIIIADDHAIFRDSLAFYLDSIKEFNILKTYDTVQALRVYLTDTVSLPKKPDIVLLDYHMPGEESLSAALFLQKKFPTIKFVFLTASQAPSTLDQIVSSSIDGVLHKEDPIDYLVQAILQINKGDRVVSQTIQNKTKQAITSSLTKREFQVLKLLASGLAVHAIANQLSISHRTIDKHKENIMHKLKVSNTAQLLALANKQAIFNQEC